MRPRGAPAIVITTVPTRGAALTVLPGEPAPAAIVSGGSGSGTATSTGFTSGFAGSAGDGVAAIGSGFVSASSSAEPRPMRNTATVIAAAIAATRPKISAAGIRRVFGTSPVTVVVASAISERATAFAI